MSDSEISWDAFKAQVKTLGGRAREEGASILFRGHASSAWDLDTTLERSAHGDFVAGYYRLILRVKSEIEAFTGLKWTEDQELDVPAIEDLCSNYDKFSRRFSMGPPPHYAYMCYLRHHGFPSPLLDWSRSPFVAAFFAFRTYSSADHTAIFAYRERDKSGMKVGGSDLPAIRVCGPYVAAPKRHFVQQSQYTICTMWSGQGPYFYDHSLVCGPFDPSKEFQQDMIYKFELPSSERMTALRELGDYGLNAYALFGSEDGLMESLSTREEASA
ncbi:hypothetical protein ACVWZR_007756 [Bradyrhizobium sp. i1.3.1]